MIDDFLFISGIIFWIGFVLLLIYKVFITKQWAAIKITNYFFGTGLVEASKKIVHEFKSNSLSDDTIGEFTGQFLLRLTRIGVYTILFVLIPMTLLFWQNRLISNQNSLISNQIELDSINMDLVTSQNRLIESDRRSSLIMLMSDIMNQINIELNSNDERNVFRKFGVIFEVHFHRVRNL